ncbi:SH3 domain-containing protein [Orrella sp. JC864]|uniref:SH3 domain-containing protein n=1 Tax=Orrella sp. JC864 TaxID=3120298 RepID=UPI00300B33D9
MKPDHQYIVVLPHASEFPEPMTLKKGDWVSVGELYDGPESWPGWYLCTAPGQAAGFVPEQILDRHADGTGTMLEDFTNRELNVAEGELLYGARRLNGWLWATRISDGATGWVPLDNIRAAGSGS